MTASKVSLKYALAKFYIIDFALKGARDPVNEFIKRFKKSISFKVIVNDIKKIKKLNSKFHPIIIKNLGMVFKKL